MRAAALRDRSITIEAPRPLVFEMAAAVGGMLPGAPRHESQLVSRDDDTMIVRYRVPAGPWTLELLEEVRLAAPDAIHFRVLQGPLAHVIETLEFVALTPRRTVVRYSGEVADDRPVIGSLLARYVAVPSYDRFMRRSLGALKVAAELRASRSRRYATAIAE